MNLQAAKSGEFDTLGQQFNAISANDKPSVDGGKEAALQTFVKNAKNYKNYVPKSNVLKVVSNY